MLRIYSRHIPINNPNFLNLMKICTDKRILNKFYYIGKADHSATNVVSVSNLQIILGMTITDPKDNVYCTYNGSYIGNLQKTILFLLER